MGKRSYGTGHLYEKNGRWYGRWRTPAGTLVNRKVGAKRSTGERDGLTKAQAEKRLREMMERETLVPSPVERVRVAEAGAALLLRLRARGVKISYFETVESTIRVHLSTAPEFANKDLAAITEEDVERYIASKQRVGLAPKTIRNHLGVLHSIM